MAGQYIPDPELAPPSLAHLTIQQRLELWADVFDANEAMLVAGFKVRAGPDGDWQALYRQWLQQQRVEHDEMLFRMCRQTAGAGDHDR